MTKHDDAFTGYFEMFKLIFQDKLISVLFSSSFEIESGFEFGGKKKETLEKAILDKTSNIKIKYPKES